MDNNKLRRTLLRIVNINGSSINAVIPGWNPHETVQFSSSLIPDSLKSVLNSGVCLFVKANTSALKAEDLRFQDFELAPEPNDDDGLA